MLIDSGVLKRVNDSIVSNSYLTAEEVAGLAGFDMAIFAEVAGDMSQPVKSIPRFFELVEKYMSELTSRVKMLNECFVTIHKWQRERGLLPGDCVDGSIVWDDSLSAGGA